MQDKMSRSFTVSSRYSSIHFSSHSVTGNWRSVIRDLRSACVADKTPMASCIHDRFIMSFIIFGSSCFNLLVKESSKAFNTRLSFAGWSDDRLGETILKGFPKFGKREWPYVGDSLLKQFTIQKMKTGEMLPNRE